MFEPETSYPFSRVGTHSGITANRKHVEHLYVYSFKTQKAKYLVEVERYPENIYILKFYKRTNRYSKERYNLLTQEFRCSRIVGTCFSIFLKIFNDNPSASLGFIGAYTIDSKRRQVETKANTKRYRIYTKAMINYFGLETFTYFDNPGESFYLAVSNANKNVFKVAEKAAYVLGDLLDNT